MPVKDARPLRARLLAALAAGPRRYSDLVALLAPATHGSITSALGDLVHGDRLERPERGMYRLRGQRPPPTVAPPERAEHSGVFSGAAWPGEGGWCE